MHVCWREVKNSLFFLQALLFTAFLATVQKIITYALVSTWSKVSSEWEHVPRFMTIFFVFVCILYLYFVFVCLQVWWETTLLNIWCLKQMHLSSTQCAFACLNRALEKNSWILTESYTIPIWKTQMGRWLFLGDSTKHSLSRPCIKSMRQLHNTWHLHFIQVDILTYCVRWQMCFGLARESHSSFHLNC